MFKKSFILLLVILSCISLCHCGYSAQSAPNTTKDDPYDELLEVLEAKLNVLQGSYAELNDDAKAELEALKAEIERLKGASSTTATTPITTTQAVTTAAPQVYRYRINDRKAIITGIVGSESNIIIPATIDGFEVYGVDEGAFANAKIKSVVISEGVEVIDWFAFSNCGELSSITLPKSIKQIGYGAFDGSPQSFTIYCHKDSFAEAYAKSYGLAYAFI